MTKKWMSVLLVLFLALAVPRAAALEPTEPGIGTAVLALSGEEPVQAGGAFALTVSRIYAPDNETGSTSSLSIAASAMAKSGFPPMRPEAAAPSVPRESGP